MIQALGKTVVAFGKVVTAMALTPLMKTSLKLKLTTMRLFLALKMKYVKVLLVKLVAVVSKSSQGQKAMIRQTRFQNPQDVCYGLAGILKLLQS